MREINDRCPFQDECERRQCEFKFHERDCSYYQGNARPGVEIEDQQQAMEAEWEARMSTPSVLDGGRPAELEASALEPVIVQGDAGSLVMLPVDKLFPHPDNPRKDLGDLTELADSIKANGVLQNLTVVPNMVLGEISNEYWQRGYRVVIGHRRLAAAKLAGLKELPCVITQMTDREQLSTMLMENMQRSDLTVYEQAQGFQMMLDMGDTVEQIAEKSGFSTTTVRRRVKLLELDKEKFKKSEERGATLFDYVELDKIKDIDRKNAVLEFIGTENFKYKLRQAIDAEKAAEKLDEIETAVSAFATKVETEEGYRYANSWGTYSKVEDIKAPDDASTVQYFYIRTNYNRIRLMTRYEGKDPTEDLAAKEREAKLEARRSGLAEATRRAYELHTAFAASVPGPIIKKHLADIVAAWVCAEYFDNTGWIGKDEIEAMLGVEPAADCENGEDADMTPQMMLDATVGSPERVLWRMIYLWLNDGESNGYYTRWPAEHAKNEGLDAIYALLEKLGYEMSDDEKALQNGTHELFSEVVGE